jgi:hypothetical protein
MFSSVNPRLTVMANIRGGVFTRADARACGYDDAHIDYLLQCGSWRRVGHGKYALRRLFIVVNDEMLHLRRLYSLLYGGRSGLVASHQSAAGLYGLPLWGLDLSELHVTPDDSADGGAGTRRRGRGVVHRHAGPLPAEHVRTWNRLPLVAPSRAVAEVCATAHAEAAVVCVDAAMTAGLVDRRSLRAAVDALPSGRDDADRAIGAATGRAESIGESRLRYHLRCAGLPEPSTRRAPLGHDYNVPALWFPDQRTAVEFDPWLPYWHDYTDDDERPDFSPDEDGPPVVEHVWIPWADLDQPDVVVARVRAAFARAEARSGVRQFDPTRPRTHRRRFRPPLLDQSGVPC